MRRRAILVGCAGGAAVLLGTLVLAAAVSRPSPASGSVSGSVASPAAAVRPAGAAGQSASPAPSGSPAPAAPSVAAAPGACPAGGLDWTAAGFSAVAVDPGNSEWLVQEHGQVKNDSPAPIILGDGVGRVGRTTPPGQDLSSVVDVVLTPAGSLTLSPGQAEKYSAAQLVESAGRPRDLGPGLADARWATSAVAAGCPGPAGAAVGSGSATSLD